MDQIEPQISKLLFDHFGLCPDYTIQTTDLDWIELFRPAEFLPKVGEYASKIAVLPLRFRLYLNEHRVKVDANWITARFAVDHPSKSIFLKISRLESGDSFATVQNYD